MQSPSDSSFLELNHKPRWAFENPPQGSSPDFLPGQLLLAVPFISLPSCWTHQEQLGALLLSSPPHTFPNSIFLLITMLYEHQMLPNDSLNCITVHEMISKDLFKSHSVWVQAAFRGNQRHLFSIFKGCTQGRAAHYVFLHLRTLQEHTRYRSFCRSKLTAKYFERNKAFSSIHNSPFSQFNHS